MNYGQITIVPQDSFASERDMMTTSRVNAICAPVAILNEDSVTIAELADDLVNPNLETLSGTTPAWAMSANRDDQMAYLQLTANATLTMTGLVAGMWGRLIVEQDGTGGWTLALPAGSKVSGGAGGSITPTAAAGAVDVLAWWYDGTQLLWHQNVNHT